MVDGRILDPIRRHLPDPIPQLVLDSTRQLLAYPIRQLLSDPIRRHPKRGVLRRIPLLDVTGHIFDVATIVHLAD